MDFRQLKVLFKVTFRGFRGKSDHTKLDDLLLLKKYKFKNVEMGYTTNFLKNGDVAAYFKILETLKVAMEKVGTY